MNAQQMLMIAINMLHVQIQQDHSLVPAGLDSLGMEKLALVYNISSFHFLHF